MRVLFILPALAEALSPHYRPIKYSLFPPLGLASLAAYLDPDDDARIVDEHVEALPDGDPVPDLVAIQVYITSARRAYQIADQYRRRGAHVALGGLHVTTLPEEAGRHADTIFLGPAEESWPRFLADFRAGRAGRVYRSQSRSLVGAPMPRRDLLQRGRYLAPNVLVASRGCPHACDFCYKPAFFAGGPGFYTQAVDRVLAEIEGLSGRHLFFLDDHLFGSPRFAAGLLGGLRGMGRVWQAAGTVQSVLQPGLMEQAAASGLRSLFIGFETLNPASLAGQHKLHNLNRDYDQAIQRLHDLGVMVNASFVFGMDEDGPDVFARTVDWAEARGIETATFHILTPYPGTALRQRLQAAGRILSADWDHYDTRQAVYQPARMSAEALEAGYVQSYRDFYAWPNLFRAANTHPGLPGKLRHLAYSAAWKKAEPLWNTIIQAGWLPRVLPVLEWVLEGRLRRTWSDAQPGDEPATQRPNP